MKRIIAFCFVAVLSVAVVASPPPPPHRHHYHGGYYHHYHGRYDHHHGESSGIRLATDIVQLVDASLNLLTPRSETVIVPVQTEVIQPVPVIVQPQPPVVNQTIIVDHRRRDTAEMPVTIHTDIVFNHLQHKNYRSGFGCGVPQILR